MAKFNAAKEFATPMKMKSSVREEVPVKGKKSKKGKKSLSIELKKGK